MHFIKKNMRGKNYHIVFIFLLISMVVVYACKKDQPVPENPYSKVDYSTSNTEEVPLDSNSIEGLHKNIFSVRCNNPGCHDGTFEPDFRTVQSTYSTLVYQTPVKNTLDGIKIFQYRVLPFDTVNSWIHERLTTETAEYMPSNGVRLSQKEIDRINNWIMNGAKDMNGNIPTSPNFLPNVIAYVALDSVFTGRLDTNRLGGLFYNPFMVDYFKTINLVFFIEDDTTQIKNLLINQVRMSLNKDDFSNPVKSYNCQYLEVPDGQGGTYRLWYATLNTKDFAKGSTVYFRYYCNDITHTENAEFPQDQSLFYYKSIYAFYVNP
jgi:hypothetical protein